MLINEFEILYWFHLMRKYLQILCKVPTKNNFTSDSVRLFFFQTAMFVKRFLYKSQEIRGFLGSGSPFKNSKSRFKDQIESIEAYIKTYHYSNFDEVYQQFDKKERYLINPNTE